MSRLSKWLMGAGIAGLVVAALAAGSLGHLPSAASAPAAGPPTVAGCPAYPADNIWNVPVDRLPLDANSAAYVQTIGPTRAVHADFGSGTWNGKPIGIPFTDVPGTQPRVSVLFEYAGESDPGTYPIPDNVPIEGGGGTDGDRHALIVDHDACRLYELYALERQADGWHAGSGAIFDLRSNALRPLGWTSADAAGFAILPGLVRYDEVASGEIRHAIRFTAPQTRNAYIWPATHLASSLTGSRFPPMGQRFRLKSTFDESAYPAADQVILRALKRYGMFLADNGSSWYLSGAPDSRWDNDVLHRLGGVSGANFEAVDESTLMIAPTSGQARGAEPIATPTLPPPTFTPAPPTATPTPCPSPTLVLLTPTPETFGPDAVKLPLVARACGG